MEELEELYGLLPKEIGKNLQALSKANNLEDKKALSEIVRNLCQSLGVFIEAMDQDEDQLDFDEDDEEDFEEQLLDMQNFADQQKKKGRSRRKAKDEEDDDMPF